MQKISIASKFYYKHYGIRYKTLQQLKVNNFKLQFTTSPLNHKKKSISKHIYF